MIELQIAIITSNEESGICPDILDLTDKQKDFLVTAALKSGNESIKEAAIEAIINDYALADALDSSMFKATDSEIVDSIRNNLYMACESLIQDAIDQFNDEVRERECEPARPDSDFH